jgi:hypothetical protein
MVKGVADTATSARVFSGADNDIVVWERGKHTQPLRAPFAVRRAFGLDGRSLDIVDGQIKNPDAIVYLETEKLPANLLDTDSLDNRLLTRASIPQTGRKQPSPVIAYPRPAFQNITHFSPFTNYTIVADTPVPVGLELANLSGTKHEITLRVKTDLQLAKGQQSQTLEIPPFKTIEVPFEVVLTKLKHKRGGFYDLGFQIEGNGFTDHTLVRFKPQSDNATKLTIQKAPEKWIHFGGLSNYRQQLSGQPWVNREDLDASFRCSYTSNALVLEVDVEDNVHFCEFEPGKLWMGDSLQIGIQRKTLKSFDDRRCFVEYTIAKTPKKSYAYRRETTANHPIFGISKIPVTITRNGTKTFYKLTIPPSEFEVKEFKSGDQMRMSLLLNENDGHGRRGVLLWGDGLHPNKKAEEFNLVLFQ